MFFDIAPAPDTSSVVSYSYPRLDVCKFCGKRKPTVHFGDALSFTHGGAIDTCMVCVLEKQIEHVEERARVLPELKRELEALLREELK